MLTISGNRDRRCDGVSRRNFLKVGAMGIGGLTLADIFALESRAGIQNSNKAIINIFLGGGPSHTDMFDLKPNAPKEYRGEFSPIRTNVAGMHICEHFPMLAQMADRFAIIRSIGGTYNSHSSFHTQTGWHKNDLRAVGGYPSLGSVVTQLQGSPNDPAPPFVSFMGNVSAGFLGPTYQPYRPDGAARQNLSLNVSSADRLRDRSDLLKAVDRMRRDIDMSGEMEAVDQFTERAVGVVTSGKLGQALDYRNEKPETLKRYLGTNSRSNSQMRNFLVARRLIEVGVRCVTLNWGGWDTHGQNFVKLRQQLPALDRGLSALIEDLHDRRMLDDVAIVMWGEFGRTPKVNKNAGRDHWSRVMQAFIAGGGMEMGQVIGETDRVGGEAAERPVHLREVFATLYRHMGIDVGTTKILDTAGRPQYLVDDRKPIKELIGRSQIAKT